MKVCRWCNKHHDGTYSERFCSDKCRDYYFEKDYMETIEEDIIKCPYCDNEDNDEVEYYYDDDTYEYDCPNCEKTSIVTAVCTWTITTAPSKEEVERIVDEKDEDKE